MGQSTFNLSEFFNRLGIKNPRPTMLESVQPVIVVGDFENMTPAHNVASAGYGGTIGAIVGERGVVQITSRSPGGTLINWFTSNVTTSSITTEVATAGLTLVEPLNRFSLQVPASLVEDGTDAVIIAPPDAMLWNQNSFTGTPAKPAKMWLAPGLTMQWIRASANQPLNNWTLWISDLPAAELPA